MTEYDGDTEKSVRRPLLLAQAVHRVIAGRRARAEALIQRPMKIADWVVMSNVRLTDLEEGYGKLAGDAGSKLEPPKLKTMASSPTNKCRTGYQRPDWVTAAMAPAAPTGER
jgi:hypothetical protein